MQTMIDDQTIRQATEEVLTDLNLTDRRFEIETALGASNGEATRQIRLFDADGTDQATAVDFRDKNGNVSIYFDEIKEKIRKQLEVLIS
jgi:hypothetical protein